MVFLLVLLPYLASIAIGSVLPRQPDVHLAISPNCGVEQDFSIGVSSLSDYDTIVAFGVILLVMCGASADQIRTHIQMLEMRVEVLRHQLWLYHQTLRLEGDRQMVLCGLRTWPPRLMPL